jgi:hypothetical protein
VPTPRPCSCYSGLGGTFDNSSSAICSNPAFDPAPQHCRPHSVAPFQPSNAMSSPLVFFRYQFSFAIFLLFHRHKYASLWILLTVPRRRNLRTAAGSIRGWTSIEKVLLGRFCWEHYCVPNFGHEIRALILPVRGLTCHVVGPCTCLWEMEDRTPIVWRVIRSSAAVGVLDLQSSRSWMSIRVALDSILGLPCSHVALAVHSRFREGDSHMNALPPASC